MFQNQIEVGDVVADSRVRICVRGQSIETLVAQIAGFGRHVQVLGPPEARLQLARIGSELCELYLSGPSPTLDL
jgi:hypothetical protein